MLDARFEMTVESVTLASLDEEKVNEIRNLEQKIGTCIVAYERKGHLASLSPAQIQELKSAEQNLGVILLAYECR
jgi:hypothetical protein